jgi:hypothetical protein
VDPDSRFGIIEKHWCYFLGFGAPYTLLNKTTSLFVGYGLFLALFPFCIMLGGMSDYTAPYKAQQTTVPPLRIFWLAQRWTLSILRIAGRNIVPSSKKSSKSLEDPKTRGKRDDNERETPTSSSPSRTATKLVGRNTLKLS